MRSSVRVLLLLLAGWVDYAAGHAHCLTKAVDLEQTLNFCPTEEDGVCCTEAEDAAVEERFNSVGTLTDDCADFYKQFVCAECGPFSGHLFERLGDGLTMTNEFCSGFVDACSGQIDFPAEDGQDYCTKHTGGGNDLYWSFPYTQPTLFDSGYTQVFPDLSGGDMPAVTLAMHQTPGGDVFWLSGKEGVIKEVDANSKSSSTTVMDISGGIFYDGSPEEGLLDFAFNPMFETNGYFYVSYTIQDDVIRNRLSKFQYFSQDPDGTRDSEEVYLTSEARLDYLHNGGWLGFKPSDYGSSAGSHDLYWSIGDGGPQEDPENHAQRTDTLFGSVIRISVPSDGSGYDVPSGNYPGDLPEICAIGLRSHWRCGFDRDTDELYCGSVGDAKLESIYKIECGNNYGWVRFEGSRCTEFSQDRFGSCDGADRSFYTPPIFEYCHFDYSYDDSEAVFTGGNNPCGDRFVVGNAVIGGYVYRGQAYADLDVYGAFIFADYEARNVYYIKQQGDGSWVPGTIISDGSVQVVSFSEDIDGEIMMIDQENNVYYMPCGDVCENAGNDFAAAPGIDIESLDPAAPGYEELGCFIDSRKRVLTARTVVDETMTTEECASLCEGSTFFGTEYSDECFCGSDDDDPTRLGDGTCDRPCAGDSSETCGGRWSISVYKFV